MNVREWLQGRFYPILTVSHDRDYGFESAGSRIERVARQICVNLGLDPDETVGTDAFGCDTPWERATRESDVMPMVFLQVPRWRTYSWKASEAIATQKALRDCGI